MYGQTFRKRPLFHAPSLSSEIDDDKQSLRSRTSVGSRKSGRASLRSGRKSVAGSEMGEGLRHDSKWLKTREYLLLLIEASLSLSVYVVRERNLTSDETMRLKLTKRQADISLHLAEGHSAWVSMIMGCLADSYFRHYTMALFSVILHFVVVCIVFMEDTIKGNQHENPYGAPVRIVCIVALVLIRSTDFTRLVYGLEGMTNRRTSTICMFIFFHFWVSSYSTYGGIFVNVFSALFNYFKFKLVRVSFLLSGISLFLFVYLLYPETHSKEHRGLGCGVVGCLLLATYYRIFRIRKRGRRGFLGNTEGTYTKTTISRTKEIFLLYALLLPAFAIALTAMLKADVFFESILRAVKGENFLESVALMQLARDILSIAMLLSYFVLWPLLTLAGVRNKNTYKFLVGHLLVGLAYFYAAILAKTSEQVHYPTNSGFIRVFNTREKPVYFIPQDLHFTSHTFGVQPKKGIMVAYQCSRETLFAMNVSFNGTNTNYTIFLSVIPDQTIGYMVLEPPEVVRIRGPTLPLREGPPGTNRLGRAKMYIYNTARTLEGATIKIKYAHERLSLREVVVEPGTMTTISLEPAIYDFVIVLADIKQTFTVEEGALYGMMIYSTLSSREMEIDMVLGPDTLAPWALLGMYFVTGLASGLCYPSLRAIIFTISPHGLMAMSFAFLGFLEGISLWFMYIGFRTWHIYMTGSVLFAYAAGIGVFFFLFMFVLMKYRDSYT